MNFRRYLPVATPLLLSGLFLAIHSQSALANECPYVNFAIVDGKCVNLDPQMKTPNPKKSQPAIQSSSEIDELTGSTLATYASLLSLVGGSVAGYKFLVRK